MLVRHRTRIAAVCPVNGDPDHYVCDVYPTGLLYCEAIRDAVAALTAKPITQEALTQGLAARLGCKVRTRGRHCQGEFETVVVAPPVEKEG